MLKFLNDMIVVTFTKKYPLVHFKYNRDQIFSNDRHTHYTDTHTHTLHTHRHTHYAHYTIVTHYFTHPAPFHLACKNAVVEKHELEKHLNF